MKGLVGPMTKICTYVPYVGKFWSGTKLVNWAICQYFTCQLFLLVFLLATEVTKQLPFNSLNVSYSAYYSASLSAILLAHTDTERFTRSLLRSRPSTGPIFT